MKRFLRLLMVAVMVVAFVLPLSACGNKIVTLSLEVSVYNVEDEKVEDKTINFDLYANLAPDAVNAIKGWVNDGYYNGLVLYKQSKYINQSTSSQLMYGGYKLENGKLIKNAQKVLPDAEFEKNGTVGSDLSNVKGAIGLWRDWSGTSNGYRYSGFEQTNSTLYIPTTSLTTYDGYFCLLGKYSTIDDLTVIEEIITLLANEDYYTSYTCYYEAEEDGSLKLENGNPVWKSMLTEDYSDVKDDLNVYSAKDGEDKSYELYTVSVINADKLTIKSIKVK